MLTADRPNRQPGLQPVTRSEFVSVVLIVVLFVLVGLSVVMDNTALGHDESVYALRAEAFQTDQPATDWHDYRAPGLPWLLQFAFVDDQPESEMRAIVTLFGCVLVLLTWVIGRQLFGRRVALLAAIGVSTTPAVLRASTQIWPDIPGAAVSLAVVAVYLGATTQRPVRKWVLAIIPLVYWATILRFGAPIPLAVALVVISLVRWDAVLRSWKLITLSALGTGLAVFSVLLVPDLTGAAGSPLAAFMELRSEKDFPLYQGIIDYARQADYLIGGANGLLVSTGVALALFRRRAISDQGATIVLLTAVGAALAIGLSVPGEPRYLSVVFPLLWIIAAAGLSTILDAADGHRLAVAVTVAALFLAWSAATDQRVSASSVADGLVRTASRQIEAIADGDHCGVLTGYTPQVRWYSDCETSGYVLDRAVTTRPEFDPGAFVFLLWLDGGKRQPADPILEDYQATSRLVYEAGTPGLPLRHVTVRMIADS